jgi:hypothetical protein
MSTTTTTTPVEARIMTLPGALTADLVKALSDRDADVRAFAFAIVEARLAKGVNARNTVALTAARDAAVAGASIPQRSTTLKRHDAAARKARSARKAVAPEAVDPMDGMVWDENDMIVPA